MTRRPRSSDCPSDRPLVVVAGALAQRPGVGGHAWVFLNWLLGLRDAGFDVLFLDRTEPEMFEDHDCPPEASAQWRWLAQVMSAAGFGGDFAMLHDRGHVCVGLSRTEVLERAARAVVLLNFLGYLDDAEILAAIDRKVFVDIDPGFPQLWLALGLHDAFAGHDVVATVGLHLGEPGCRIPLGGIEHVTTLPPVALGSWPATPLPSGGSPRVTSVVTWRGPFGPVDYEGERYGLRVHEFRRFAPLPRSVPGAHFELALDIEPADAPDAEMLRADGWELALPRDVARDPAAYRRYLRGSCIEVMVAKEMYVRSRGGWFSDRSACYLASGRPVVAQDTGFSDHLPTGEGLLSFTDPVGAAEAIAEVLGNRSRHAKAARELAVDRFDATKVIPALFARIGVT
jgi:hypothetical protein